MSESPQDQAARQFMEQRGYHVSPVSVERVENDYCWYFYYELADGDLELEVSWDSQNGWRATVTDFALDRTDGSDDR